MLTDKEMQLLEDLCSEYDNLVRKQESVYDYEIDTAINALKTNCSEEWESYQYWMRQRELFNTVTEKQKEEMKPEIVALVKKLGKSYKAQFINWVLSKGTRKIFWDKIEGTLIALKIDPTQYYEMGESSVRETRVKAKME